MLLLSLSFLLLVIIFFFVGFLPLFSLNKRDEEIKEIIYFQFHISSVISSKIGENKLFINVRHFLLFLLLLLLLLLNVWFLLCLLTSFFLNLIVENKNSEKIAITKENYIRKLWLSRRNIFFLIVSFQKKRKLFFGPFVSKPA